MAAPVAWDMLADLAAACGLGAWIPKGRGEPPASLDEVLLRLPEARREEVRAFLQQHEVEDLEDLAAVTAGDLTEAFEAAPGGAVLSQRTAVRSLCSLAREREEALAEAAAEEARRCRWARRRVWTFKALLLVAFGCANSLLGTWASAASVDDWQCSGRASGEDSGVKVLIASFEGTGSRTVLDALAQLGFETTYASEDFSFFVWSRLARDFWQRRENGERYRPPWPRPTLAQLAELPWKELWSRPSYRHWSAHDLQVLNGTRPGDLAAAMSRCQVEVVALDGMERLTWPVYEVSKSAKVISLSHLAYPDYAKRTDAEPGLELRDLALAILTGSQYVLPWGMLFQVIDYLEGNKAYDRVKKGRPFSQATDTHGIFLYIAEYLHRVKRHAYGGLSIKPDPGTYDGFHGAIRKNVPSDRLLEFDLQRHTWKDLCDFLGKKKCPFKGRLEEPQGSFDFLLQCYERMEWDFYQRLLFYVLFWYVNWKVLSWSLPTILGLMRVVTKPVRVALWRLRVVANPMVYFKINFVVWVASVCEAYDVWGPLKDHSLKCEGPVLPNNASGVKVMVAGFAKSGTRTMSRTLWQLGLNGSYHSEELGYFWWGQHHDSYWLRPENGGVWMRPSFSRSHDFARDYPMSDPEVIANTPTEEIAAGLSRCRVEAVAFDAIENLFWPVYNASPGVKVISLHWRSFEEHYDSMMTFHGDFNMMCSTSGFLFSALHGLPWVWVFEKIDALIGGPMAKMLREGRPAVCQDYKPWMAIHHNLMGSRRIMSHWYSGLPLIPYKQEIYDGFYQQVRNTVPKDKLFEWNMRKNNWEDLCSFLEVDPCPRSGKLERAPNVFNFERDYPVIFLARIPFFFLLHNINGRVYSFVIWLAVALLQRLVTILCLLRGRIWGGSSEKGEAL